MQGQTASCRRRGAGFTMSGEDLEILLNEQSITMCYKIIPKIPVALLAALVAHSLLASISRFKNNDGLFTKGQLAFAQRVTRQGRIQKLLEARKIFMSISSWRKLIIICLGNPIVTA